MLRPRGFTLIELIMVILLLGIVATISVQFVVLSTRGAIDMSERQQRALKVVVISERLSRELRGAVPGSVKVDGSGNCISFLPAEDGWVYEPTASGYAPAGGRAADDAVIASPTGNVNPVGEVTQTSDISPESRLYYVRAPVLFFWTGNILYREQRPAGSDLNAGCPGNAADAHIMATDLRPTPGGSFFASDTPSVRNNALVHFNFIVDSPGSDESLAFSQTLQVRNVP